MRNRICVLIPCTLNVVSLLDLTKSQVTKHISGNVRILGRWTNFPRLCSVVCKKRHYLSSFLTVLSKWGSSFQQRFDRNVAHYSQLLSKLSLCSKWLIVLPQAWKLVFVQKSLPNFAPGVFPQLALPPQSANISQKTSYFRAKRIEKALDLRWRTNKTR